MRRAARGLTSLMPPHLEVTESAAGDARLGRELIINSRRWQREVRRRADINQVRKETAA